MEMSDNEEIPMEENFTNEALMETLSSFQNEENKKTNDYNCYENDDHYYENDDLIYDSQSEFEVNSNANNDKGGEFQILKILVTIYLLTIIINFQTI